MPGSSTKPARRSYEHSRCSIITRASANPRATSAANHEDNGLSPKTPKVTDETKEAEPRCNSERRRSTR